jgi:ergothioneine biosynthesis protein EgtB
LPTSLSTHLPGESSPTKPSPQTSRFLEIRNQTERLCEPLQIEDFVLQSMPDASPTKWHLAHTTWFFETFVLSAAKKSYRPFHPQFNFLFNSYYNAIGSRHPRPQRGLLSRPNVEEIFEYRRYVDQSMAELFTEGLPEEMTSIVELGLHHEQQHQELLLTDIKHAFSQNPLYPTYRPSVPKNKTESIPLDWIPIRGGLRAIGFSEPGFCFDNELPRHSVYIQDFVLGSRLITNREYQHFIADKGYQRPELWLSDGWDTMQSSNWTTPLYWLAEGDSQFTLNGLQPIDPDEPVCHLSYYEADAFARWSGARLPTEFEWELAAQTQPIRGNFVEEQRFHPIPTQEKGLQQLFGDVWEWTSSPYIPYPGYQPATGAIGEYNGKFMCNQLVLRGGSCATPQSHLRSTYRNFFHPDKRWQFSGIRLAKDL